MGFPPQRAHYLLHESAVGSFWAEAHEVVGTHHPPRVLVLAQGTCHAKERFPSRWVADRQPPSPSTHPSSSPCLQKPRSYEGQPTMLASACRRGQSLLLHSPAGAKSRTTLNPTQWKSLRDGLGGGTGMPQEHPGSGAFLPADRRWHQALAGGQAWNSSAGEGEAPAPTERGAETALGHPALVTLVQEAAAVALGAEPAHQGPHPTSGLEGAAHTGPPHAPSVTPPCAPQHPLLPCLHPGSPILRLLAWSTQGGAFPWGGDVQHPLGAQGLVHKELTRSGCPGEARALPSAKGVGAPIPRAGRMMGSEQC